MFVCERKYIFDDFFAIFKKSFKAIQEIKRNWVKPTEGQMQELEFLQENANKAKVKWNFKNNMNTSKEWFLKQWY